MLSRIWAVRRGGVNESAFGRRMVGSDVVADQISDLFRVFALRHELGGGLPPFDCSRFRPPPDKRGQGRLC